MSSTLQAPRGLRVVVGVTGGIAAYKAVSVVRQFVQAGADVTVVPTASALKFVGTPTWEAISRNQVPTDLFDGVAEVTHVALGQQADLIVVAPATAHFIAQYASGLAGDLLGTTLLATTAPIVIAPAMHTEMWEHPATKSNVETLIRRGVHLVGPGSGALTGSDIGPGRMAEPDDIVRFALNVAAGDKPLAGKRVLVSAGGTREPLDPVRYIGNRSSGVMGVAIATVARNLGASVTLVHANLEGAAPEGVELVSAPTAEAMRQQMLSHQAKADVVIMAAAVADWTPETVSSEKISKSAGSDFVPRLVPTADIAAELGQAKPAGQLLVTFSAETEPDDTALLERAQAKGEKKNADLVVANRVGEQVGFGESETAVWFIQRSGAPVLSTGSKFVIAGHLFEVLQP